MANNNPFSDFKNVRRGAGPVSYSWSPLPFEKRGHKTKSPYTDKKITCDNKIDNVVTYVYDTLQSGNHLAYVTCDYVI